MRAALLHFRVRFGLNNTWTQAEDAEVDEKAA